MNKENILKLAERIENLPLVTEGNKPPETGPSFSMNYEEYKCGAPACIAGWGAALALNTNVLDTKLDLLAIAATWMGLPRDWARTNLFYPGDGPLERIDSWQHEEGLTYDNITPKAAADVLRNLAELEDYPNTAEMARIWEKALAKENII
jgi:hypothetical protein